MSSLTKPYNFEKYSVLDIQKFLEGHGYKTEFGREGSTSVLKVINHDIYIVVPAIFATGHVDSIIFFGNDTRLPNYEKSKKLYALLKCHFSYKKNEVWDQKAVDKIKDADKFEVKDFRNKE